MSEDLERQLRAYGELLDDAARPVTAAEARSAGDAVVALEAGGSAAARRRWLAVAALVALVAGVGALLAIGDDDGTDDVRAEQPEVDLMTGWERIDDPFGPDAEVLAVGSNGDELLALVDRHWSPSCPASPVDGPRCHPLDIEVWLSPDGIEWAESEPFVDRRIYQVGGLRVPDVPAPSYPMPTEVHWNGQQWLVTGLDDERQPVVWARENSGVWIRSVVAASDEAGGAGPLVMHEGGSLLGGSIDSGGGHPRAAVWSTIDTIGIRWGDPRVTIETVLPREVGDERRVSNPGTLAALVAGGPGFVAAGGLDSPLPVWASADGASWRLLDAPPATMGARARGGVAFEGDAVLVGDQGGYPAVWRVDRTGTVTLLAQPEGDPSLDESRAGFGYLSAAANVDGLVATGYTAHGSTIWVSPDAETWTEAVDVVEGDDAGSELSLDTFGATAHADGFVVAAGSDLWLWARDGIEPPSTTTTVEDRGPVEGLWELAPTAWGEAGPDLVTSNGNDLVAIGDWVCPAGADCVWADGQHAWLSTDDGSTWERTAQLTDSTRLDLDGERVHDLTWHDGRWYAVGTTVLPRPGLLAPPDGGAWSSTAATIWVSEDGRTWSGDIQIATVDLGLDAGPLEEWLALSFDQVASTPAGLVVTGTYPSGVEGGSIVGDSFIFIGRLDPEAVTQTAADPTVLFDSLWSDGPVAVGAGPNITVTALGTAGDRVIMAVTNPVGGMGAWSYPADDLTQMTPAAVTGTTGSLIDIVETDSRTVGVGIDGGPRAWEWDADRDRFSYTEVDLPPAGADWAYVAVTSGNGLFLAGDYDDTRTGPFFWAPDGAEPRLVADADSLPMRTTTAVVAHHDGFIVLGEGGAAVWAPPDG